MERQRTNGWWASRRGTGWSYTCREVIEGGHLTMADYHYVEGETQRHFPEVKP